MFGCRVAAAVLLRNKNFTPKLDLTKQLGLIADYLQCSAKSNLVAAGLLSDLCSAEKSVPLFAAGLLCGLCVAGKSLSVPLVPCSPKGGTENRN